MKKLLTILLLAIGGYSNAQICNITVTPEDTLICPNDSVYISANAFVTFGGNQSFNFNFGTLPLGWSTSGGTQYSQPCLPGIDGTAYFWASTAGSGTPVINTPQFDVECGGVIQFDMVFAVQGGGSPCEGPDEQDEGVSLQYSTDGGLTWIDIVYYSPGGFELPSNPGGNTSIASGQTPYTTWGTFYVPIPPGAMTQNTEFQWIQTNSSGTCCDNWGLDNIFINAGPCGSAVVNWSNGYTDTTEFWVAPSSDTTFVAYVYDTLGVLMCVSDTIYINIQQANMTWTLPDTVYTYCPWDSAAAQVTNMANVVPPVTFDWSNGQTTNPAWLAGQGIKHDTLDFQLLMTDGCGFTYPDDITLVVNQTLNIDTILSYAASSCSPTGAASAFVSGVTGTPYYNWTGPGNPGPYSVDATVIQNVPTGWYYFTVEDNVCMEEDSVFIDFTNPPVANFSITPDEGCVPVQVSFANSSSNTVSYQWIFGNGNTSNAQTPGPETFSTSATVMLIAYDASNCPDTAYASVTVVPCGCTDPVATNYNPLATIDDGSCIYPNPTVTAPNVFTPDPNPENNFFELKVTNTVELTLTIVNRWGSVMYEKTGPGDNTDPDWPKWDGRTPNNKEAEEGVYFYRYSLVGLDGSILEGHGYLHLIRKD